ncbi:sodium-dependent glucose transporter 1A-like [Lingula anatina]|uniref:Sodium-dependent glucose transporter 1A-like n=1 Tax=Lingula anatina TaxID=7574 RepID=A0A1S3HQ70_LINAN|nr:sodium-dependent glucose transporter 1A-like [Lingula anatina]|eukprot:XP_013388180.1 sodium-dependent glucose transporter 1A-like [Lingula anatina]
MIELTFPLTDFKESMDYSDKNSLCSRSLSVRGKRFQTFAICAAMMALGASVSIPGPTLIDLRKQVGASVESVTYAISGRSAGLFIGSISGGIFFDHMNHHLILSLVMILTAVTNVLIPFASHLSELAACLAGQGIVMGCLDTCGNAMILELWEKKSGPYLQLLHFSFGVGAFVAPIIAQPLLSKRMDVTNNDTSNLYKLPFTLEDKTSLDRPVNDFLENSSQKEDQMLLNTFLSNTTYTTIFTNESSKISILNTVEMWTETRIMYAYIGVGMIAVLCTIPFIAMSHQEHKCLYWKKVKAHNPEEAQTTREDSMWFKVPFLLIFALYILLYVGLEITFGTLVTTFGFETLHWSKPKAANLSTVFWGCLATTRGLSIIVSKFLSSTVMTMIDLALMVLTTMLMSFLVNSAEAIMWICTALYGIGLASVFPAGVSWANRYVHITGKAASLITVGAAIGMLTLPALFGHFFQINGMHFAYISLGGAVGNVVLFTILYIFARFHGERYLPVPQQVHDNKDEPHQDTTETTDL